MTEKEKGQEGFYFLAETLARAGMFEGLAMPIIAQPQNSGNDARHLFPCIHTDEEKLRRLNAERDEELRRQRAERGQNDDTQRDPVSIRSIDSDSGRYYVALPRSPGEISRRAVQLLQTCIRLQEER